MRLRHLLVGVVVAMTAVLVVPVATPAGAGVDPQAAESAFVAKINALRASKGLGTLAVDAELTTIARRWAARMAAAGDISHNRNFQNEVTADWVKLGENVGMGPEIDKLHRAFVASPTHYKNLVDGDYTRVGVGVVVTADGMIFTAHQFERVASDNAVVVRTAAPAAPKPAPGRPQAGPGPQARRPTRPSGPRRHRPRPTPRLRPPRRLTTSKCAEFSLRENENSAHFEGL